MCDPSICYLYFVCSALAASLEPFSCGCVSWKLMESQRSLAFVVSRVFYVLLLLASSALGQTFYLDDSVPTNGNGAQGSPFNSVNNAWPKIEQAVKANYNGIVTVIVATGIYLSPQPNEPRVQQQPYLRRNYYFFLLKRDWQLQQSYCLGCNYYPSYCNWSTNRPRPHGTSRWYSCNFHLYWSCRGRSLDRIYWTNSGITIRRNPRKHRN